MLNKKKKSVLSVQTTIIHYLVFSTEGHLNGHEDGVCVCVGGGVVSQNLPDVYLQGRKALNIAS